MPGSRLLKLKWPMAGVNKRYAYNAQPPYTTPDALNVRPDGTLEGRERGGSRPGIGKAFLQQLGSGNPIRLLNSVTVAGVSRDAAGSGAMIGGLPDGVPSSFIDDFEGGDLDSDTWTTATWIDEDPEIWPDDRSAVVYEEWAGAVCKSLPIDTSEAYTISCILREYNGAYWGKYFIYLMMNSSGPDATDDGVTIMLEMIGSDGSYSGSVTVEETGETPIQYAIDNSATLDHAPAGELKVRVDGTAIKVYWREQEIFDSADEVATWDLSHITGARVGFGAQCTESTTSSAGVCFFDRFKVDYLDNTITDGGSDPDHSVWYPERWDVLIASSNGLVYRDNHIGEMTLVSLNATLNTDRMLFSTEYNQKLWIADCGYPLMESDNGELDVTKLELTDDEVTQFVTTFGVNKYDHVVIITYSDGTSSTHALSTVTETKLTLATAAITDESVSYRIERGPKIFDPSDDSMTLWTATSGYVPLGCPLICLYRDRLVLAGAPQYPHAWFMSRQDNAYDFDYTSSPEDPQRAVAGDATEIAGKVGDAITALIPWQDDYLIFGCPNSLWILRGDPAWNGQVDNLSHQVGIISGQAWCSGPNGEVIFLSRDGLYMLEAGMNTYPQSLSRENLPRELLDVDPHTYTVTMSYDVRDRGVHLYLTPEGRGAPRSWWFDWETKSFWPVELPADMLPTSLYRFAAMKDVKSAVLLGSKDGYIRRYDPSFPDDDGTSITSFVLYGPIQIGGNDYVEGLLQELVAAPARNGGSVSWAVWDGETNEEAIDNVLDSLTSAASSGTWTAGLNSTSHPMVRNGSFVLRMSGYTDAPWAIERVTARCKSVGKQKVL